jgi:glyoxylase-like metal-dependent hydrolase (beta-lactamase superfamily II)
MPPGDSKGAISIILDKSGKRFVFCGDLISEPGKVHNIYDFQWHYLPHPAAVFSDWVKSLEKLDSLRPDLLCPSHGSPMEDSHQAIRLLISRITGLQHVLQPERKARATLPLSRVLPHLIYVCDTTYLILSESGKGMIIDYGYVGQQYIDTLTKDFGLKKIDLITITHYHDDHCARVPELQYYQAADRFYPFSEVQVCTIEELADVLEKPGAYRLPCLPPVSIHPQKVLKSGTRMKWEEYELYFYHQPGQTHYAMGLYLEMDGHRVLFTGDNIWPTAEGGLVTPILFKNIAYPESIVEAACQMQELNPDILATGHYGVFDVTAAMLSGYKAWAIEIKDRLYEIVSQDPLLNGIDPSWASFYPYTVYAHSGEEFRVSLRLKNHSDSLSHFDARLKLPGGFESKSPTASIEVAGGECVHVRFDIKAPAGIAPGRRFAATAEITRDGHMHGEVAEFIIEIIHTAVSSLDFK